LGNSLGSQKVNQLCATHLFLEKFNRCIVNTLESYTLKELVEKQKELVERLKEQAITDNRQN
jgi:DNA-binding IscR family transcriptional regulator